MVQVAYAIGVADPVGIYVNTNGSCKLKNKSGKKLTDSEIALKVKEVFDLRPFAIVKRFGLKNPIFAPSASYGHFGRDFRTEIVEVYYQDEHTEIREINNKIRYFKNVEFFAWEKLDYVDRLKLAFEL